jgi:uncharacterized membrane protein
MQRIEKSIRIRAPVDHVYGLLRDFTNLPSLVDYIEDIVPLSPDDRTSHWIVRGPGGAAAEFDAEIVEDEPNRSIGWRSLRGDIGLSGNVTLAELENETLVHVILQWYGVPSEPPPDSASPEFQELDKLLGEALRRFKHVAEGEQLAA